MAKVIIPTPLRKFTENQSTFTSYGKSIQEVLNHLVNEHVALAKHLLDGEGKLRSFIKVYVGEDDIRSLNNEATALNEHSVVSIVPAIAGG